jgi:peptide/nickel transport system substrate-binding protein
VRTPRAVALALAVLCAGALSGCETSLVVDGSIVTVASAAPFTAYNDQTSFGNTPANASIVGATNAGFTYYDDTSSVVRDESFGHYEIVSQDPFSVRYTVAPGVTWSDGEPVDAADLLLAWAANSGVFNTDGFNPARFVDEGTGQFEPFPDGVVYFDGAFRSGLQHVVQTPVVGDDGRSITLRYDEYFVDWELAFDVGLPAHVVAEQAGVSTGSTTEDEDAGSAAKRAVIDAIVDEDTDSLAALAAAWNSAFNSVTDPALLVGSGPYTVTELDGEDSVTLTANPLYTGKRQPRFETVVIETITDPLEAVTALREGSVDVIAPTPTEDVVGALADLDDVEVEVGESSMFEHLDLQFSGAQHDTFTNPSLREAFLLTVPRDEILKELVTPVAPDAVVRESFVLTDGSGGFAQNLARARSLVARSGVAEPRVCVLFDPSNPRRVTEFQLIKQSAELAGFVVGDCSASDWEGFLGVQGIYDAALFAWNETSAAASSPEARLRSTSSVSNFSNYASETVDRLLDELDVEQDQAARRDLLEQIDAALWSDFYGLPLYQYPLIVAHSSAVENVSPSALSGPLWNLWEWQPPSADEESRPDGRLDGQGTAVVILSTHRPSR